MNSKYTLNSEPKALTGDKSEGIKSRDAAEALSEDLSQLKPRAKNSYVVLHKRIIPAFQRKQSLRDKLLLAKSKTARPPLLSWRSTLVRILVFSSLFFPPAFVESRMAQVDRLRIFERGVFSVQARSVADPLLWSSLFSFQNEDLEKFQVFPQSG